MSDWLYVTLLGIIQGLTEFLPVSSSGHLTLLNALFGFSDTNILSLVVVMHAGSLVAIVAVYLQELLKFMKPGRLNLLGMVILATIPAGVVGVAVHHFKWDERFFGNLLCLGVSFLVTGAVLRLTGCRKLTAVSDGERGTELADISWRQALIIGLAQVVAIAPGISRSGSTISAGVLCGVKREAAATFSFLLAIPVIGGAVLVKILGALHDGGSGVGMPWWILALGFVVSAAVSAGALLFLIRLVRRGKLYYFSWYMLALGAAVTLWQVLKGF